MADAGDLIARLIRGKVRFVVIGGFAAVAHGSTLQTQDLDICCDFSEGNLARLAKALADLHPVHRITLARPPLRLTAGASRGFKNLYLDTDLGQLDCLSGVSGVGGFEEVRGNSESVKLRGGVCRVLSLDALIRSKQAMGRPRDREAVIQLKAIRERKK